ncbi:uncharacterized protein LOC128964641 [Oppia nitens]|uniref:uncharacterized protein LOC128964641 n=1 Tax=Oppia nitens TaxID=1686743 RepID=UPI0023DBBA70|nr:uncharacterized protein LOC128964641 [Oppia nitens]
MKNKQFSIVLFTLIALILIDKTQVIVSKPKPFMPSLAAAAGMAAVGAGSVAAYKHITNVKQYKQQLTKLQLIYGQQFNGTLANGTVILKNPALFKLPNKKLKVLTTTTKTTVKTTVKTTDKTTVKTTVKTTIKPKSTTTTTRISSTKRK